jgi:hypothetical protein
MIEDGQLPKPDCISINIKELIDGKVEDLKDIIDARFKSVEEKIGYQAKAAQTALDKAFDSTQLAISKVEIATANRFESVNEFRLTLKDQVSTFATRNEIDSLKEIVNDKMSKPEYDARHLSLETKMDDRIQKFENYYTKTEINTAIDKAADETKKVRDGQIYLLVLIIIALVGVIADFITRR